MIREFDETVHSEGLRACLIELQDAECLLDPRMPSGAEIVDYYMPQMLERCASCGGKIFVEESNAEVAGFATILAYVTSDEIEAGDVEYGLISDLFVASKHRGQGIGKKLLKAAEIYARSKEVRWLRIGVLAKNHLADGLYEAMGFEKIYIEREKDLSGT